MRCIHHSPIVRTTVVLLAVLVRPELAAADTPAPVSSCDVSSDGITNVVDIQLEIDEALRVSPSSHDLNNDGVVNAADVQMVINAALGLGCSAIPGITDFNPKTGSLGTLISVVGFNLGPAPQVSLSQQGGGTLGAALVSASATAVSFVVPPGSATGPIRIATASGTATGTVSFTVTPSSGFTLGATPQSANLIQGQSVSYAVLLTGAHSFDQLAQLSVSGVPSGISAAFQPASIADGQTSVLTLTAPASRMARCTASSPSASLRCCIRSRIATPTPPR